MTFGVPQKILEALDWPQVLARVADLAGTPGGRRSFAADAELSPEATPTIFADSLAAVTERLAETGEARRVLQAGDAPPLSGVTDVAAPLARARKGGVLGPAELRDVGATLAVLESTRRFFATRAEEAPRLAGRAAAIADGSRLAGEIDRCIDPAGEVRDAASPALADARRESQRLAAEIQSRIERTLRDDDTAAHLSDRYFTVRNDRFVLPVRADSRGSVRGIVHDASKSGTTLFVEPEALVELNNRRKRAEIDIEQAIRAVLSGLSREVAGAADDIEPGLAAVVDIDRAFARGRYGELLDATEPEVGEAGVARLRQLRHPLLPRDEVVPNDVALGEGFTTLVISGPNAGGKTVAMKAVALAALFVRAGLHVPAETGSRMDLFDEVLVDIGDEQNIREHLSTFSAHMANLAQVVDRATARSLVILDEVGVGTDPGEGAALAQAVLEKLADVGARTIVTTHYNLLKELAEVDDRFANASVEFDPETLAPTYRLIMGAPGSSSARAVAARMGLPGDVLDRAGRILEREDRQLDKLLADLAASRHALERERREVEQLRAAAESVREEHRVKLERLAERRDALFASMRQDLDRRFREAHAEVAGVIRDLQRGGRAQDAARARERLERIEQEADAAAPAPAERRDEGPPLDWHRARAGDPVHVTGAGSGTLEALPDRRGRAAVRVGGARLSVPAERVRSAAPADAPARPAPARVQVTPADGPAGDAAGYRDRPGAADGAGHCDLRGLRVAEALDRLDTALDRAVSLGREQLTVVHGVGTGALRAAVREHLGGSPYVAATRDGERDEGGDGATIATLR